MYGVVYVLHEKGVHICLCFCLGLNVKIWEEEAGQDFRKFSEKTHGMKSLCKTVKGSVEQI